MKLYIYTDGASRGNPGEAAIAVVVLDENKKLVTEQMQAIGRATNNQAEYRALLKALEVAEQCSGTELEIFSDSEVMVRQITGEYKVKNPELERLFSEVKKRQRNFRKVSYHNVRRTDKHIQRADRLVNYALDRK